MENMEMTLVNTNPAPATDIFENARKLAFKAAELLGATAKLGKHAKGWRSEQETVDIDYGQGYFLFLTKMGVELQDGEKERFREFTDVHKLVKSIEGREARAQVAELRVEASCKLENKRREERKAVYANTEHALKVELGESDAGTYTSVNVQLAPSGEQKASVTVHFGSITGTGMSVHDAVKLVKMLIATWGG